MTAAVRGRGAVVGAALVLGLVLIVSGTATWFTAQGSSPVQRLVPVTVSGSQAAPAVTAAGLVVLAAAAALGIAGRVGRWVAAAATVGGGAVAAVSAVLVLADPGAVAASAVAQATGVAEVVGAVSTSPAPVMAVAAAVVTIAVGCWAAVVCRSWTAGGRRHEPARPPAGAGRAAAGPVDDGAPRPPAPADRPVSTHDAWDALSAGEDPT